MKTVTTQQASLLLIDLAVILVLARLAGALARRLDQPPVIGEVLAGILVGPTLFHGAISSTLFPPDVRPFLTALANLGVAVFMFMIGLELDNRLLRGNRKVALTVSAGSIIVPFCLGAALALLLLETHPSPHRLGFALFLGAAMSITAFPVLARILTDRRMDRTRLGGLALTCAAVDDVVAWTLLAVVVAITGSAGQDQWHILLAVPYLLLMIFVVRPLLRRLVTGRETTAGALGVVVAGLLLSGAATEWLGLHFIFGAFFFGVMMPKIGADQLKKDLGLRLGTFGGTVLLPIFFVSAGLKVDLSTVGVAGLGQLGLILLVAIGGKFIGAYVGARVNKLPARESATLATLMNARGLTELIILSVGLQLGILDAALYSLMVVMAVVTTAMTGPLLRVFYPHRLVERDLAEFDLEAPVGAAR